MSIPNNVIGYAAIFLPELDEFQGFYVVHRSDKEMPAVLAMLAIAGGANPVGAVTALMVEGLVSRRQDVFIAAVTAYHHYTGKKFFYVVAGKDEAGTETQVHDLAATTIEEARAEINALPMAVSMLKKKGLL